MDDLFGFGVTALVMQVPKHNGKKKKKMVTNRDCALPSFVPIGNIKDVFLVSVILTGTKDTHLYSRIHGPGYIIGTKVSYKP